MSPAATGRFKAADRSKYDSLWQGHYPKRLEEGAAMEHVVDELVSLVREVLTSKRDFLVVTTTTGHGADGQNFPSDSFALPFRALPSSYVQFALQAGGLYMEAVGDAHLLTPLTAQQRQTLQETGWTAPDGQSTGNWHMLLSPSPGVEETATRIALDTR
jgi:hypothetical protein